MQQLEQDLSTFREAILDNDKDLILTEQPSSLCVIREPANFASNVCNILLSLYKKGG